MRLWLYVIALTVLLNSGCRSSNRLHFTPDNPYVDSRTGAARSEPTHWGLSWLADLLPTDGTERVGSPLKHDRFSGSDDAARSWDR